MQASYRRPTINLDPSSVALASDILTFAHQFDLVFLVIEPLDVDLAFVVCDARADLDLDQSFSFRNPFLLQDLPDFPRRNRHIDVFDSQMQ